jgi:hydroxymethylpyrimidine pyrophosphatase-like HAD family hydrolase
MNRDPAVVAIDVDGTLFDGVQVDAGAIDALRAAHAAGHVVVIVTGRPWRDLAAIIPDVLPFCAAAVCEHGALLVDIATDEVAQLAPPVDASVVARIAAHDGDEMVVYEATVGLPASARQVAEAAVARVDGAYVVANKDSIAIVPVGCDKGTGLRRAISHLGLEGWRVIAIGDATNDLPMFAEADVAVAVANAEPALIGIGIEVTSRPFGGGVAEALERHLPVTARQGVRPTPPA